MIGLFALPIAHAQIDTTTPTHVPDFITTLILNLAMNHPRLSMFITFMGSSRIWAKPLMSFIHQIVELSPSKRDDGILTSLLSFFNVNPIGRVLAYLIDWLTSIKIQVPNNPDTAKPNPVQ